MGKGGSFVIFSGVAAAKIAVGTMAVAITNAAADPWPVPLPWNWNWRPSASTRSLPA
jgi:hypothetical protein